MQNKYHDWPWKPMDTIPVDHELNTLLRLNPEFPLAVSHDNLSSYQNSFVNWHKQGSIEIAIVTEASVTVNLLNDQRLIKAGEGFIILPGILHSIRSGKTECFARYQTIFFEPCLLTGFRNSYFEKHFYKPEIIKRNSFFHFSMNTGLLRPCVEDWNAIINDNYWGDAHLENQIHHKLQKIWIALWNNAITVQTNHTNKTDDARLLQIVDYLQKNYQKKFDLDELCTQVNLSRSACCRYFKKMMNMSISDYILEYRLSQALFMLDNTNESITEIALHAGFSTTSYFISRFKEKMHLTPLEYKMKMGKS